MGENWTPLKLLNWTTERFEKEGLESPRLDAQVLLAHTLGLSRIQLYAQFDKPMGADELGIFREYVKRRLAREPVAYIVGYKEFWSRSFSVTPDVLIPRPDSELLIERILDRVNKEQSLRMADVGCGSGALGITLACELPGSTVTLVDVSPEALAIAEENGRRLCDADRLSFVEGDLLEKVAGPLDLVVANLPYVTHMEMKELSPEVSTEPVLALDGGQDGLDFIRRLLQQTRLVAGGWIFLEHGNQQGPAVRVLCEEAGMAHVETARDLAGHERITFAQSV